MLPKKLTRQVICDPDYPVVETKHGKLRGMEVEGAFVFRGVRYAKARRFHEPAETDAWDGIKNAVEYGPCCRELSTLTPQDAFTVPHFWYPQDEDCLNLNIWTQTIERSAKRPVMVWIHGGGFHHGSGYEIYSYDGEELSAYTGAVTVAVNHRLNVLGYCDLSGFGDQYRYSGNLGTMDLVAALKWIQKNIEAFGGDPENVLIFGQSGGAGKVLGLLQTPEADGLYHRASMQSGVGADPRERFHDEGDAVTRMILTNLGIDPGRPEETAEIETVPFHRLALACNQTAAQYQEKYGKRMQWMPISDGDYYAGHPGRRGFRQETLDIPVIIGTVMAEFNSNTIDPLKHGAGMKRNWSEEYLQARLAERFGEDAGRMRTLFKEAWPEKCEADVLFMDFERRLDHMALARLRAGTEGAAEVYTYLLSLDLPADGGSTAWHNAEEPFVFHNCRYVESTFIPGITDRLEDMMSMAWYRFAVSGNPNHEGMPTWEPLADNDATMVFDAACGTRYGFDNELLKLGSLQKGTGFNKGPKSGIGGSPRVRI